MRLRRSPWRRRGPCRPARPRVPRDEEAAPARVLSEREEARVAVVRRPERGEQRLRVLPSGRGDRHRPSVCAAADGRDEPAGSPTRTAVTGLSLSLQEDRHERALRHAPSGPVSTVSRYAAVDRVADGCDRGVVRLLGRRRARRRSADPASGEHAARQASTWRLPAAARRVDAGEGEEVDHVEVALARAGSVGRQSGRGTGTPPGRSAAGRSPPRRRSGRRPGRGAGRPRRLGLLEHVVPERRRALEAEAVRARSSVEVGRREHRHAHLRGRSPGPTAAPRSGGAAASAAAARSAGRGWRSRPAAGRTAASRSSCRSACSASPARRRSRRTSASR